MSNVLKFSDEWQEAIVGYMLKDYQFFLNCKTFLKSEWFLNPFVSSIVKVAFDTHEALIKKKALSKADLEGKFRQIHVDTRTYNEYVGWINRCYLSADRVNLDILSSDLTTWIRLIKLREALIEGERLFNNNQYNEATLALNKQSREIQSMSFAPSIEADFSDPMKDLKVRKEELGECMTMGSDEFDDALRTGSKKILPHNPDVSYLSDLRNLTTGSLAHGDSTVIIGPVNTGKTSVCVTIICANIRMDKDVLFITLEQKERDVKVKLLQCFQDLTIQDLSYVETRGDVERKVLIASSEFNKHLTYISHADPNTMYVEDLLMIIESAQEKRKARNNGKGYDLLVVDYPGILQSRSKVQQKSSGWEQATFVYNKLYSAARYHNMHGIFPLQTNRDGYKVSKGDANRFVDSGDAAQAFNITHNADNVVTLNRSAIHEAQSIMQFFVAKSRFGKKAWAYTCKTAFDKSKTHGIGLPGRIEWNGNKGKADMDADMIIKSGATQKPFMSPESLIKTIPAATLIDSHDDLQAFMDDTMSTDIDDDVDPDKMN